MSSTRNASSQAPSLFEFRALVAYRTLRDKKQAELRQRQINSMKPQVPSLRNIDTVRLLDVELSA